jgi:hypothetical protein
VTESLPYGTLRIRNPEGYLEAEWSELTDLYRGGYTIAKNPQRYLPRMVAENEHRYQERIKSAGYLSYLGQVVDYFTASLFAQELTVKPAMDADDADTPGTMPDPSCYGAFEGDADLRGNPFSHLLREAFTEAILKKRAVIAVDFPRIDDAPATRADEQAIGADRPYAVNVSIEQLIDWEEDDRGGFVWAILQRKYVTRPSPSETRGLVVEDFKVWTRTDGVVSWSLYRVEYAPEKPPQDKDVIACVDSGVTSFGRIPLIVLEVPDGLWVGNKIGTLAKEHYQRRTSLVSAENRSLVAIPVAKLGSEMSAIGAALPSEAQQNPNRGHDPVTAFKAAGFMTIGKDDSIEFVEPIGAAYTIVDKQLETLKDEMFRVVHQMAASVGNKAGAMGRSGHSKQMDRAAEAIVLGAYGSIVRAFAKKIYETISEARSERVVWNTYGLDEYESEDRETLMAEAMQVDSVSIPSKTFKKTYKTQLAVKLITNASPETMDTIRQEIEEGVESEAGIHELMRLAPPMALPAEPDGDDAD